MRQAVATQAVGNGGGIVREKVCFLPRAYMAGPEVMDWRAFARPFAGSRRVQCSEHAQPWCAGYCRQVAGHAVLKPVRKPGEGQRLHMLCGDAQRISREQHYGLAACLEGLAQQGHQMTIEGAPATEIDRFCPWRLAMDGLRQCERSVFR